MAHTPGPWLIADNAFVYALGENGCNSFWGLLQASGADAVTKEELAANARLIAAAPDLLEALKACKDALDWVIEQAGGPACEHDGGVVCFCKENNAINLAAAAINKAEATP